MHFIYIKKCKIKCNKNNKMLTCSLGLNSSYDAVFVLETGPNPITHGSREKWEIIHLSIYATVLWAVRCVRMHGCGQNSSFKVPNQIEEFGAWSCNEMQIFCLRISLHGFPPAFILNKRFLIHSL